MSFDVLEGKFQTEYFFSKRCSRRLIPLLKSRFNFILKLFFAERKTISYRHVGVFDIEQFNTKTNSSYHLYLY